MEERLMEVPAFMTAAEGASGPLDSRISAYVPPSLGVGDFVNANVGGALVVMKIMYVRKGAAGRPLVAEDGSRLVDLLRGIGSVM